MGAAQGAKAHFTEAPVQNLEGVLTVRWIRMRRLERCRADLENPEMRNLSISEIAFNHGFSNISSFNRAFKARFKVAPTALRNS
ncbi:helix-turn-helix domain-containing protein [Novosphingobium sp. MMS21-SN21R]|uniref:helix-turn-helix domain-containing protein n=1 Tax=Novosphingobium sp. MMS21-SN21R TaxID=2969298 RepID=UPI00390467E8